MKLSILFLLQGVAALTTQQPLGITKDEIVVNHGILRNIIDGSPLLSFHRDIVDIESISGNEYHVGNYIVDFLRERQFTVEKQIVSDFTGKERFNVYAYPGNTSLPEVLVTSHIDTVPPFLPYTLKYPKPTSETEGLDRQSVLIGGRGTVDAKASVAAQVFAVLETLQENPDASVGLLFVVGEEKGGQGMGTFSDSKYNPSPSSFHTVIFGEPTALNLVAGHKGGISFTIKSTGKAAHSGYPWLGRSAISALLPVASLVEQLGDIPVEHGGLPSSPKYGNATVNLGLVHGGVAANVVPASAEAVFSVRVASGTPDENKAIIARAVEKFTANNPDVEVAFTPGGLAPIDLDVDVDGFDIITVNYGTDIPKLTIHGGGKLPVKRYLYGPGSILVAHGDHEALTVGDLETAVQGFRKLINVALARGEL